MSIWQRLLNLIGSRPKSGSRTYEISESLQVTLATIAKHEGRPEDELLPDVLAAGLTQYVSKDKLWNKWQSLTAREQDVAALACLGYTNADRQTFEYFSRNGQGAPAKGLMKFA
jgi:DNA-binding CsgD family transcriptional regulator